MDYNHLSNKSPIDFNSLKNKSNSSKIFKKCEKGNFYLGLYPHFEWIDIIIDLNSYSTGSTIKPSTNQTKKNHSYQVLLKERRIIVL